MTENFPGQKDECGKAPSLSDKASSPSGKAPSLSDKASSLPGKTRADAGPLVLTQREKNLLRLIRDIGHGELRVLIQDGSPLRAEEIRVSIKL